MDTRHGSAATEERGGLMSSRLRPWMGALGYLAAQALIALLGISWGPMGLGLGAQGLLLVSGFAVLVAAGYQPRYFERRALQYLLLSLGWALLVGAGVMAWNEPYVFVRESEGLGPGSYRATLHPFFTGGLNALLFLAALGRTVSVGPGRGRLLWMDAPLLAFVALCLMLHRRGYPSFEG